MDNQNNFELELEQDLKNYIKEDCLFLESNKENGKDNDDFKQFVKDFGDFAKKRAVVIKGKAINLINKIKKNEVDEAKYAKLPDDIHTLTKATIGIGASTIMLGNPLIGFIGWVTGKHLHKSVDRNKRIDLIAKYKGEIDVIDEKLKELDIDNLQPEQKKQKYELLKIREKYVMDIKKLKLMLASS